MRGSQTICGRERRKPRPRSEASRMQRPLSQHSVREGVRSSSKPACPFLTGTPCVKACRLHNTLPPLRFFFTDNGPQHLCDIHHFLDCVRRRRRSQRPRRHRRESAQAFQNAERQRMATSSYLPSRGAPTRQTLEAQRQETSAPTPEDRADGRRESLILLPENTTFSRRRPQICHMMLFCSPPGALWYSSPIPFGFQGDCGHGTPLRNELRFTHNLR